VLENATEELKKGHGEEQLIEDIKEFESDVETSTTKLKQDSQLQQEQLIEASENLLEVNGCSNSTIKLEELDQFSSNSTCSIQRQLSVHRSELNASSTKLITSHFPSTLTGMLQDLKRSVEKDKDLQQAELQRQVS
jgi:hypothetical protein